jgi:hypothetical protein|tara:strand:- start:1310 stop:1447 length:138 start_codon:yes stop_codon:yes gene_type:complete
MGSKNPKKTVVKEVMKKAGYKHGGKAKTGMARGCGAATKGKGYNI